MKHLLNTILLSMLFIFVASCGQNDSSSKEEQEDTTSTASDESTAEPEEDTSLTDELETTSKLDALFRVKDPSSLEELKTILGEPKMVEREAPSSDLYDSSTWEFEDGMVVWFDDAQGSGFNIEAKEQEVINTTLGVSINQSSLDDCKKALKGIEKSISEDVWKYKKDNLWIFLYFNADNQLTSIKISGLDLDAAS